MKLNERELATVLAALRYWQDEITNDDGETLHGRAEELMPDFFADEPCDFPLSADEIDDLCERMNLESCEACHGKGWLECQINRQGEVEIQRCDACERYPDDETARDAAWVDGHSQ